ncbi:MAG: class I SAM-dependent methyltransferase [Christensenellales bacterium]
MLTADGWKDYKLIDAGGGEKLEDWGGYLLSRPEPQAIWPKSPKAKWDKANAVYTHSISGKGAWQYKTNLPEKWEIEYKNLRFYVNASRFKQTGLFPEQAVNWDWMSSIIKGRNGIEVLNLFAYTGGATVACAAAGAAVVHVDAAKASVGLARENAELSGLAAAPIRYIVDDAFKFVEREKRRGRRYHGIIMDPPSYGKGPGGQLWKIEDSLFELVKSCSDLLSDNALFFLINSYTTGLAPSVLSNIMSIVIKGGSASASEIGIKAASGVILPCGAAARWSAL